MSGINLADRLKRYDAHTAVSDEFRARTTQGASLSILAVLSALYFLTTELRYNFETTVVDRVYVNSTSSATAVQMEFDVVFPEIACGLLGVDANDAVGNSQGLHIDRTHHVYKHRLDNHGRPIHRSKPEKVGLGGTVTSDRKLEEVHAEKRAQGDDDGSEIDDYFESDFCGDCYSAGEPGECCNTCDDVKRAYRKKGWTLPNQKSISQCKNTIKAKDEVDEGCRMTGNVQLSSAGGNLHIAPGRDVSDIGSGGDSFISITDLLGLAFEKYNVTHTIQKLHFGPRLPEKMSNVEQQQLDGQVRTVKNVHGMYQYYLQIVPTRYVKLDGTTITTNQMSVTEHMRIVKPGSGRGMPGVFFFYEVSPFHVIFEENRRGWIRFFTSVCAIVGGVYTVLGMIDKTYYMYTRGDTSRNLGL